MAAFGLGAILGVATGASAATVENRATGLASPDVTIEFGVSAFDGQNITTQYLPSGVTFGPNYQQSVAGAPSPSIQGGFLSPPDTNVSPGSIFFTSDVSAAVFGFGADAAITTFSAVLNGGFVETFDGATNFTETAGSGKFYGFEGIVFDEIQFELPDELANFSLDNLQYTVAAIPLPAALPLFLMALAGLGLVARRRRKKALA